MRLAQVVEDVDGHMAKAKMDYYQKCAPALAPRSHPPLRNARGGGPGPSSRRARPPAWRPRCAARPLALAAAPAEARQARCRARRGPP